MEPKENPCRPMTSKRPIVNIIISREVLSKCLRNQDKKHFILVKSVLARWISVLICASYATIQHNPVSRVIKRIKFHQSDITFKFRLVVIFFDFVARANVYAMIGRAS